MRMSVDLGDESGERMHGEDTISLYLKILLQTPLRRLWGFSLGAVDNLNTNPIKF
jgi:hypothetical protein